MIGRLDNGVSGWHFAFVFAPASSFLVDPVFRMTVSCSFKDQLYIRPVT